MSVGYFCPHLADPSPPLPSSYASSSSSFFPLDQLYFCEECDAVRCDLCCVTEIASYFCPNCTFDVPSANVRGDKNRWVEDCVDVCLWQMCAELLLVSPMHHATAGSSDGYHGRIGSIGADRASLPLDMPLLQVEQSASRTGVR